MKTKFSPADILWLVLILYGIIVIIYRLFAPRQVLKLQTVLYKKLSTRALVWGSRIKSFFY